MGDLYDVDVLEWSEHQAEGNYRANRGADWARSHTDRRACISGSKVSMQRITSGPIL